MLICWRKEVENKLVSVRKIDDGDIGQMEVKSFVDRIMNEIQTKKLFNILINKERIYALLLCYIM